MDVKHPTSDASERGMRSSRGTFQVVLGQVLVHEPPAMMKDSVAGSRPRHRSGAVIDAVNENFVIAGRPSKQQLQAGLCPQFSFQTPGRCDIIKSITLKMNKTYGSMSQGYET
jgi:hypothetical protein